MRKFAGGVGTADIYFQNKLIASANTLTDTTLTISTTQDEVRGGLYAPVQYTFTHDASVKVTLTDILWDKKYLELQLGANFGQDGDSRAYTSEEDTCSIARQLSLSHLPVAMDFGCGEDICLIAYRLAGTSDDWATIDQGASPSQTLLSEGLAAGKKYCVRYAFNNVAALKASITSHINPAEVRLIIRAPLFAGDACDRSQSQLIGEVQYVIPRFKFDGNQTISGAMSSAGTSSLTGTALASDSGCELSGGKLLDIIEVTDGTSWTDGVVGIALGDDAKQFTTPDVYFVYQNGDTRKLAAADIGTVVNVTNSVIVTANFTWAIVNTSGAISLANITAVAPLAVKTIA